MHGPTPQKGNWPRTLQHRRRPLQRHASMPSRRKQLPSSLRSHAARANPPPPWLLTRLHSLASLRLLLRARQARRLFKSTIAKKPKSTGKKLIDLSKLVSPSTSASSSKDKTYKVQKAVFSLVRATYQKGDKKDQYSGAIYYRGKPRWGMNDKYKAKLFPNMLAESLRWNDELKLYSGKVWTAEQAQLILDAMRQVSAEDEKDLEDVTVDV